MECCVERVGKVKWKERESEVELGVAKLLIFPAATGSPTARPEQGVGGPCAKRTEICIPTSLPPQLAPSAR